MVGISTCADVLPEGIRFLRSYRFQKEGFYGVLNIACGRGYPKAYGVRAVMRFRAGRLLMVGC